MVDTINDKIAVPGMKLRDKGQTPISKAADKKKTPETSANATSAGDSAELNASGLSVPPGNIEATTASLPDKETADRVLEGTAGMIRNEPEKAEAAQANISAEAVLKLLKQD